MSINVINSKLANEKRFKFGKNWQNFLKTLNQFKINAAISSLVSMLDVKDLKNITFLDVGSGSGLFSLAAKILGANVYSFDYDQMSVECTKILKNKFFPNDNDWIIEKGDVLDKEYLNKLGKFDIVYSWGVLHHTGNMWQALENVSNLVKPNGKLYISIYNDQGVLSQIWTLIKKIFNLSPAFLQFLIIIISGIFIYGNKLLLKILELALTRNVKNFKITHTYKRGMSMWYDLIDWVGGYPFEVAKPEEIFEFYKNKGFELLKLKTCAGSHGCNEFVFKKVS